MTITDLEPKLVFGIFDEITKVPRPSKKEGKIREFLLEFAKRHNIEAKTDPIGNVAMRVPATAGKKRAPTMGLQGQKGVSYTQLRAHETGRKIVCPLLLLKKKNNESICS